MGSEENNNFSKYEYNPDMFDSPLKDYMINAYNTLEDNDAFLYRIACAQIHQELKWSWENEIIGKRKTDEMKKYFWGMAE